MYPQFCLRIFFKIVKNSKYDVYFDDAYLNIHHSKNRVSSKAYPVKVIRKSLLTFYLFAVDLKPVELITHIYIYMPYVYSLPTMMDSFLSHKFGLSSLKIYFQQSFIQA